MGASGDTIRLGIEVDEQGQARQLIQGLNREIAQLRAQMAALGASVNSQSALGSQRQLTNLRNLERSLGAIRDGTTQVGGAARSAEDRTTGFASAADLGSRALRSLATELLALATAFAGFKAFEAFTSQGLEFNKTVENASLGIGALITSQAQLRTSDGQLLQGAQALATAQGIAAEQLDKLRAEGLKTHATMSDLINAFQQAIGVSLRFGFSLDQAREFTVGMVRAAFALQLPLNQLQEEIRDFLQGNINPRNTRIASALGITNEQVRAAQQAGQLFDFVTKKLEAFNAAGDATANTFVGITSNAKQFLEVFAGATTKPLFDEFKRGAQAALAGVFDLSTATVSKDFQGILDVAQDIFGRLGGVLAGALTGAVDEAKDFNAWLTENEGEIAAIADAIGVAADALGTLVSEMSQFVGSASEGATQAGAIKTAIVGAGLGVAALNAVFEALVGVLGIAASLVALGLLAPFGGLTILVGKLVGIINRDLGAALQKAGRDQIAFVDQTIRSTAAYEKQLATSGDAIDRYLAKVKELDAKQAEAEGSRKARDQLRETTATLRQESRRQEEALKASLDQRLITREQYAAKLKAIQLSEVKSEEQATLDAIRATTDPRLKKALFDQIATLHERRSLLEGGVTVTPNQAPETDEQRKRRVQLLNQRADDEIRAAKSLADRLTAERTAAFDDEMAQAKNQFDTKEQTQITFFEDVEKLQFQALEKQKKIEQQRADALAGVEGQEANRQKALDRVQELSDAEFKLIADTDAKIATAHRQALDARKRLDEQGVKDEIALLQQRGEIVKATALELEAQYKDELDALAKRTDAAARQQEATIHKIIDTQLLKAEFEELDKSATDALTNLSQKTSQINALQQTGAISEREARREIIDLYKQTADVLGQLLPQLVDVAERSGDRQAIERVKALQSQYAELKITVSQVDENIRKLATGTKDALEQGLAQGLDEMTDGVHKFSDAWGEAAGSVVAALRRIASQMLATLIIEKSLSFLGNLFGGSGGGSSSLLQTGVDTIGGGNTATAAEGGLIRGPGTATSDSIPARLSDGEYVVRASATARYGADTLEAINRQAVDPGVLRSILSLSRASLGVSSATVRHARGSIRGFAEGGLVAAPPLAGLSASGFARIVVEHTDDTIVRVMESTRGQDVTVKNIGKRRNAANFALGGSTR